MPPDGEGCENREGGGEDAEVTSAAVDRADNSGFDSVVSIDRPETGSPAGSTCQRYLGRPPVPADAYPLELYPVRRVWHQGVVCFMQSGAGNILQRAARPSREGAFP
jgi:hypothetical protein